MNDKKKIENSGFINNESSGFHKVNTDENSGFIKNEFHFTEVKDFSEGAMSIIQIGKDKEKKQVAIKRIKPEFKNDKTYIELITKEFINAKKLDGNDHIVKVFEKGEDCDGFYYSMEFIEGQTLKNYITEKGIIKGKLIKKFAKEILMALSSMHRNQIFHRDLKPSNILITTKHEYVKIIDFGISKSDAFVDKLAEVGTKKYSSPEQKKSINVDIDGRSDIYSFGLILLEMISGQAIDCKLAKRRSKEVFKIINKCVQIEINRRYDNCEEIIEELNKIEFTDIKERNKNNALIVILLSIIVLLLLIITFFLFQNKHQNNQKVNNLTNTINYEQTNELQKKDTLNEIKLKVPENKNFENKVDNKDKTPIQKEIIVNDKDLSIIQKEVDAKFLEIQPIIEKLNTLLETDKVTNELLLTFEMLIYKEKELKKIYEQNKNIYLEKIVLLEIELEKKENQLKILKQNNE